MCGNWPRTGGAHYAADAERAEGVARVLLGAAFAGDDATSPGLEKQILGALAAGVDPDSEHYWGAIGDFDQKAVEAASIAIAIREARQRFFDPLDSVNQRHLLDWLAGIEAVDMSPNNWRFFRIIVQLSLQSLDRDVDQRLMADELRHIHSLYRGDGWYADGPEGAFDYYNGFAFHFYGLIYARWRDDEHAALFVSRAREFARSYRYWFADNGAQITYGRSLCYRFASAAFWGALAWFEPDAGGLRRRWRETMSWWARQPLYNDAGQLSVGYAYPNLLASEFYNSRVSPLWATKAFCVLDHAADEPFWSHDEDDGDRESLAPLLLLPASTQLLYRYRGNAYLLPGSNSPPEMRYCTDKYLKFAYSSCHGFSVESSQWIDSGFIGDNILAVRDDRPGWHHRHRIDSAKIEDGILETQWSPLTGCSIVTRQQWDGKQERRQHEIQCDRDLEFIASGHAVDRWSPHAILDGAVTPADRAEVSGTTVDSAIMLVSNEGQAGIAPCAPNTNLMFPRASVPFVHGRLSAGRHSLVTAVTAGAR